MSLDVDFFQTPELRQSPQVGDTRGLGIGNVGVKQVSLFGFYSGEKGVVGALRHHVEDVLHVLCAQDILLMLD